MDLDAGIPGDETEDIVPEDRIAAACHPVIQPLEVFGVQDENIILSGRRALRMRTGSVLTLSRFHCLPMPLLLRQDIVFNLVDINLSISDSGQKGIDRGDVPLLHHFGPHFVRKLQPPVLQPALQQFPSGRSQPQFPFVDGLLDLGTGLGRDHPGKPVLVRPLVLRGQDFHDIPGGEFLLDGNGFSIDLSAAAARTDVGMDGEGEIQHGSPCRKDSEFSGGGEDKNLLGGGLGQFFGRIRVRMLQGVAYGAEPLVHGLLPLDAFVGPMGGEAVLCNIVHPLGPDLDLDISALTVLYRNMERLVAIGLGMGHPVAEPFGVRFVFFRHERVNLPAEVFLPLMVLPVTIDDEADGKHIVNPFKRHFLLDHLGPYRIGGLGPDLQLILDAGVGKLPLERLDELLHQTLTVFLRRLQFIGNQAVLLRFRITQIDILHLPLHVVQPKLVGQRNIEHQGFQHLPFAGGLREHRQRTHHLQPVGELEDGHPRILRILDDQLLVVLRFQPGIFRLDGRNLVQPVHHGGNTLVKSEGEHVHRSRTGGFVEKNGRDAFRRQADFIRDNPGDRDGMPDEGRPVIADLPLEGLFGHGISLLNQGLPFWAIVHRGG